MFHAVFSEVEKNQRVIVFYRAALGADERRQNIFVIKIFLICLADMRFNVIGYFPFAGYGFIRFLRPVPVFVAIHAVKSSHQACYLFFVGEAIY